MKRIKPIIVIGMNRSGTKWLSNILCNHSDVIGIQYEKAYGILETNMFGVMQKKFGDISTIESYIGFIELWAQTNFFKISGIEKSFFYKLNYKHSILELFEILMNEFAKRNSKKFWLQKTSPLNALKILRNFSKGYIIIIERNILDTIKSQMKLTEFTTGIRSSIFREVFYYIYQAKIIKKISKIYKLFKVSYESLKNQPAHEIKNTCKYLNIPFENTMLNISYQKNTSFISSQNRKSFFSKKDIQKIMIYSYILKIFPFFLFEAFLKVRQSLLSKREEIYFIQGTFRMIQEEYQMFQTVFKSKRIVEIE